MPLDVTFTLSDKDLDRFKTIIESAGAAMESPQTAAQIEAAVNQLIEDASATELPDFIADRLQKLQILLNMVNDQEWQLTDEEKARILGALVYLCDPNDVIPDHIPGIGFLDDAIYVELIIQELDEEFRAYQEFCVFRTAEENRRRNRGLDPYVGREDWLADRRSVLHSRMRASRGGRGTARSWRRRLF